MRKINDAGLAIIKKYEGLKLEPYICPGGYLTIGYGHLINQDTEEFDTITEKEAEELLKQDVAQFEAIVNGIVDVELNDNQFSALVSWTYNLGGKNLQNSTMLKKINNNQHLEVPSEMLRWIFAGGSALLGLLRRRIEEARLYVQ